MFDPTEFCNNIYNGRSVPPELSEILQHYIFMKEQEKLGLIPRKTSKKSTEFRKKGNELYQKERHNGTASHRMILSLYTQSIAYAPNGSEELALALSNRSALLLHLEKYDLSLIDVDRALSITASNDLRNKLLIRQAKCLRLNQSIQRNERKRMQPPKFTPSKSIPCAADCIKLDCNEKFGRHYTATHDIESGKVLLSENTPYSFVTFEHTYLTCSQCLAFAWVGIPCDKCVYAIYCSEDCKIRAWSQYHDIQCSSTSFLTCKGLMTMNLFNHTHLVKTMIINVRENGLEHILKEAMKNLNLKGTSVEDLLSNDELNCGKFRFIYNLATGVDRNPHIDRSLPLILSSVLTFFIEEYQVSKCQIDFGRAIATMKMILKKLLDIYCCNAYGFEAWPCMCDDDIQLCPPQCASKRGFIIAPCSSLINHSCDPNAGRIFIPGQGILVFTRRPIKKGEQISISYGPESIELPKQDRREQLLQKRGFICSCQACDEDWPVATAFVEKLTDSHLQELADHLPDVVKEKYPAVVSMVVDPTAKREYSEKLLNEVRIMQNVIHENFDDLMAYILGGALELYIHSYFQNLYCESKDFSDTC